jgi:hypothetical protein
MCRISFSLILIIFISLNLAMAQGSTTTYRYYSISDGLADNNISDIVKDDYGYVWLAGQNGLTRFDGNNFVVFNNSNVPDFFSSNGISKLYSNGKKIYLLSKQEGLIELDPLKLSFKKINERGIVAMHQKNDLTAYLYSDGFLEIEKGNSPTLKKLLKFGSLDDIVIQNNKIYVSSYHTGIYEHNLTDLTQERVFYEANSTGYFLYTSNKYGIVFNLSNKLMVFDGKNNLTQHPEIEAGQIVTSFSEYADGSSQVIFDVKRVNVSDSLSFYEFLHLEMPNVELKKMLKINERTVLFASNQGLVKVNYKFQKYIKNIDDNDFFESKSIRVRRKILEGDKGKFYMMGYPALVAYDSESKNFKNLTEIKKPVSFYDGLIIDSVIYLTSEGSGFYSYSLHSAKFSKIPLSDIDSLSGLFHISTVNDSTLLLGGLANIVVYNIKSKTNATYPIGKKLNVYDIEEDKNSGTFLVATDIGLLNFKIDKEGKIIFGKKTIPTKTAVKDILIDSESKQLWLATNHGLELRRLNDFVKIKEYSKPDEIKHPKVTALQKDKNGKIWASTYSGITVIDYRNDKIFFVDRTDGLRNEEFNYKCATKLADGRFVFGGINMYDIIDTSILNNNNYIDRFYITGIQKTNLKESRFYTLSDFGSGKISFNTGSEDLIIYLSNFDYEDKSGYRFEYRNDNKKWIPVIHNRIRLSNLSAGTYKLSVRMLNPLGVVVDEKTYTLIAQVPFYQSRLFFVLLALLILLLSALSFFLFFRSFKIENRTKERIALDLHDEAGTTLTKLLMTVNGNGESTPETKMLKSGLNDALFSIRAFIQSMQSVKPTLLDFEDDIREFLINTSKNSDFKFNFNILGENITLRQELYRDLKLCIFDAVGLSKNNDNASPVDIKVEHLKKCIKLTVKIIGISEIALNYNQNGDILSNFQKRTLRHNGAFNTPTNTAAETCLQFSFEV